MEGSHTATPVSSKTEDEQDSIAQLHDAVPQLHSLFILNQIIGHGTFSSVYLARTKHNTTINGRRHFAIKHIIPTSHPSRVYMELKCLKLIGGLDFVMGITMCFRQLNHIVLVMPYFPHDSFSEYVGNLSIDELRDYLISLLVALRRVHSFNIIHRDVKPANFLYNRKHRRYSLVDFGLAQEVGQTKRYPGTSIGQNTTNMAKIVNKPRILDTPIATNTVNTRTVKRKLGVIVDSDDGDRAKHPRQQQQNSSTIQLSSPNTIPGILNNSNRINALRRSPRKQNTLASPRKENYKEHFEATAPQKKENEEINSRIEALDLRIKTIGARNSPTKKIKNENETSSRYESMDLQYETGSRNSPTKKVRNEAGSRTSRSTPRNETTDWQYETGSRNSPTKKVKNETGSRTTSRSTPRNETSSRTPRNETISQTPQKTPRNHETPDACTPKKIIPYFNIEDSPSKHTRGAKAHRKMDTHMIEADGGVNWDGGLNLKGEWGLNGPEFPDNRGLNQGAVNFPDNGDLKYTDNGDLKFLDNGANILDNGDLKFLDNRVNIPVNRVNIPDNGDLNGGLNQGVGTYTDNRVNIPDNRVNIPDNRVNIPDNIVRFPDNDGQALRRSPRKSISRQTPVNKPLDGLLRHLSQITVIQEGNIVTGRNNGTKNEGSSSVSSQRHKGAAAGGVLSPKVSGLTLTPDLHPQSKPISAPKLLHEVKTKSGGSMLCAVSCRCYGSGKVCGVCIARNNQIAPRAGTPGFRSPEVLLRHPKQGTGVDMWSVGVILLSLLSGRYPFFRASDDLSTLAEITTLLGTSTVRKAAAKIDKLLTCSEERVPLDLMKVCEILRNNNNISSSYQTSVGTISNSNSKNVISNSKTITGNSNSKGVTGNSNSKGVTGNSNSKCITGNSNSKSVTGYSNSKGVTSNSNSKGVTGSSNSKSVTGNSNSKCGILNLDEGVCMGCHQNGMCVCLNPQNLNAQKSASVPSKRKRTQENRRTQDRRTGAQELRRTGTTPRTQQEYNRRTGVSILEPLNKRKSAQEQHRRTASQDSYNRRTGTGTQEQHRRTASQEINRRTGSAQEMNNRRTLSASQDSFNRRTTGQEINRRTEQESNNRRTGQEINNRRTLSASQEEKDKERRRNRRGGGEKKEENEEEKEERRRSRRGGEKIEENEEEIENKEERRRRSRKGGGGEKKEEEGENEEERRSRRGGGGGGEKKEENEEERKMNKGAEIAEITENVEEKNSNWSDHSQIMPHISGTDLCYDEVCPPASYPSLVYHLLIRLLDPDPETRITAEEALAHPFLSA